MRLKVVGGVQSVFLYLCLVLFLYFFVIKTFLPKFRRKTMEVELDLLDNLNIDCQSVMNGVINSSLKVELRSIEDRLLYSKNRCQTLKTLFRFTDTPLSEEERQYPLAYGMVVYKELAQVLFMLSSIYHPQNEYCVAVGENAAVLFQELLKELSTCFPNVHFMKRPPIKWGSHEIINSAYGCLEFLSHLKSDWRYFQYLSGVDVPLKSNLEMVRILKSLNRTSNVEIVRYQKERLRGKNYTNAPLPLFKSSLSALIPREAADMMASSLVPRELLEFLENTGIADEGFWGTLFGNKDKFDIPGSVNGSEWIELRTRAKEYNLTASGENYYVSRDQVWFKNKCNNYMASGSCVFGIGDVLRLLKSHALVAHKFYLHSQPEAYFCILKEIRRRGAKPDDNFDVSFYRELPQVQLNRGLPLSEVTHLERLL